MFARHAHPGLHGSFDRVDRTRQALARSEAWETCAILSAGGATRTAEELTARQGRLARVMAALNAREQQSLESLRLAQLRHDCNRSTEIECLSKARSARFAATQATNARSLAQTAYTSAKRELYGALEDQAKAVKDDPGLCTPCDRAALLECLQAAEAVHKGR